MNVNKDDVIKGLQCCFVDGTCDGCPYNTPNGQSGEGDFCIDLLGRDALNLLSND